MKKKSEGNSTDWREAVKVLIEQAADAGVDLRDPAKLGEVIQLISGSAKLEPRNHPEPTPSGIPNEPQVGDDEGAHATRVLPRGGSRGCKGSATESSDLEKLKDVRGLQRRKMAHPPGLEPGTFRSVV